MIPDHPPEAIFIRWGNFQIGAFGKLGVGAVLLLALGYASGKITGFW